MPFCVIIIIQVNTAQTVVNQESLILEVCCKNKLFRKSIQGQYWGKHQTNPLGIQSNYSTFSTHFLPVNKTNFSNFTHYVLDTYEAKRPSSIPTGQNGVVWCSVVYPFRIQENHSTFMLVSFVVLVFFSLFIIIS